ncbi:MAG: hypothetical protein V1793_16350 [Pseudomonadota bacterium]
MAGMRTIKRRVHELLTQPDEGAALEAILSMDGKAVVGPLISFLQSTDLALQRRAVRAMGKVVSAMADTHVESARIVMRRLMWSLNDESGGIGWGAPEAMGEIMAMNETLAGEYANILLSYVDEKGNYLEYEPLRRGAVQGIRRLAKARPHLVPSTLHLNP